MQTRPSQILDDITPFYLEASLSKSSFLFRVQRFYVLTDIALYCYTSPKQYEKNPDKPKSIYNLLEYDFYPEKHLNRSGGAVKILKADDVDPEKSNCISKVFFNDIEIFKTWIKAFYHNKTLLENLYSTQEKTGFSFHHQKRLTIALEPKDPDILCKSIVGTERGTLGPDLSNEAFEKKRTSHSHAPTRRTIFNSPKKIQKISEIPKEPTFFSQKSKAGRLGDSKKSNEETGFRLKLLKVEESSDQAKAQKVCVHNQNIQVINIQNCLQDHVRSKSTSSCLDFISQRKGVQSSSSKSFFKAGCFKTPSNPQQIQQDQNLLLAYPQRTVSSPKQTIKKFQLKKTLPFLSLQGPEFNPQNPKTLKGPFFSLSVLHNLPKGSINLSLTPKINPSLSPKTPQNLNNHLHSSESPNDFNKKTMLSEEIEEGKKAIKLKDLNISLLDQRVINHYIKNPCVSGGNTQRSSSIKPIVRQQSILPSPSVISGSKQSQRNSHFLDKTLTLSKIMTPSESLSFIRNKKTIFSPIKFNEGSLLREKFFEQSFALALPSEKR